MSTTILTPELRRSTAEALKVARSADSSRPMLRTLILDTDAGFVTDSYRAVRMDWFAELATDEREGFDADALYDALKGAGKDWARIDRDGDTLTVHRIAAPQHWGESMARDMIAEMDTTTPEAAAMLRGTFVVRKVDVGTPPNIRPIVTESFEAVQADDYRPVPQAVNGEFLASLVKCHSKSFHKGAQAQAVTVMPREERKPTVLVNGQPYAIIMPVLTR